MINKKELNIHVGKQIKQSREAAGYTQDELAEIIQMGTKNLSAIERGLVGVSLSTVIKICKTLFITSDKLLMDNPGTPEPEKLNFLIERLKNLPEQQFELALDINNKLFEVFALQQKDIESDE